jgi:hypothetical protein
MAFHLLFLLLLSGLVMPSLAAPISHQPPHLSDEAIIGLVSVIVAVVVAIITLAASPKLRRNLKSESGYMLRLCYHEIFSMV